MDKHSSKVRKGRPVDHHAAAELLKATLEVAQASYRDRSPINVSSEVASATERLFESKTQAYRDALVSCTVARILDPAIDIRLPATEYGENAFSSRSLADKVVTPFLQSHAIPASVSPFLSALRGGAKFMKGGQPRIQRDQQGFDAVVEIVDYLCSANQEHAKNYLAFLLRRFVQLRDESNIALRRIAKPNLEQIRSLIRGLLSIKSGGRFSAMLSIAMFQTLSDCHDLGWDVEFQGINVADKASGAAGDITIRKAGSVVLGVEVTERPVDESRVALIFDQKVSPKSLADYLFITTAEPSAAALAAARNYTAVGHEMNFVPLEGWLVHNLASIGPACRTLFQNKMVALLEASGVPSELKVAWNAKMDAAIALT